MKKIGLILVISALMLCWFNLNARADCYFKDEYSGLIEFEYPFEGEIEPADTTHMDWGAMAILLGSDVFYWTYINHAYEYSPEHSDAGPEFKFFKTQGADQGNFMHLLAIPAGDSIIFGLTQPHEGHTDSVVGLVKHIEENRFTAEAWASHSPEPATIISGLLGLFGFALKKFRG